MTPSDFAEAIDPFTGQLAFQLPLMTLPGPGPLQLSLGISYSSTVGPTVQNNNLEQPTGLLGLGWALPRSNIFLVQNAGTTRAESRFMIHHNGIMSPLLFRANNSDGTESWTASGQPFWQISYNPAGETWIVLDENGHTHIFGGASGTEYAIAINDWSAQTSLLSGQRQVATTWNLVSSQDLFGNKVQFYYDLITQTLTSQGLAYTSASYLTRIEGAWGDRIEFTYGAKNSVEYAYPFSDPNPPNAYQAVVPTQYLESIALIPADLGSALNIVTFGYDLTFIGGATGNTDTGYTKRLLTQITTSFPDNHVLPSLLFAYVENASGNINPGALQQVTTLEGSLVSYTYAATDALEHSHLDMAVSAPSNGGETFNNPQLAFQDSFVVATWTGASGTLAIAPYRWEGRWLAASPTLIENAVTSGYDGIETTSSDKFFGVLVEDTLYPFARDWNTPDGWITPSGGISLGAPSGTSGYALAAGDGFLAVLCLPSGTLIRVDFTAGAWGTPVTVTTGLENAAAYALSARNNKIALTAGSAGSGHLWLAARSLDGSWTTSAATMDVPVGSSPVMALEMGAAGLMLAIQGASGSSSFVYGYLADYDANGNLNNLISLGGQSGTLANISLQMTGMTGRLGAMVWQYNGQDWISADLSSLGMASGDSVQSVTLGQVTVARSVALSGGGSRYDLIAFDANDNEWKLQQSASAPATGAGVAVAPTTPETQGRYAAAGNSLYYMQTDLSWDAISGGMPSDITAADADSFQILGNQFLVYQTTGDSDVTVSVAFLGSGAIQGSVQSVSGQLLVTGKAADFLVGGLAFAAYTGTWDDSGFALTLYRPVTGAIQGQQTALAVSSVTIGSGLTSQAVVIPGTETSSATTLNGSSATAYAWDSTAACIAPDGSTPLFNHVTCYPGSSTAAASIGGQLDLYYFNGLAASETPVQPVPTGSDQTNAASAPGMLIGYLYTSVASAVSGEGTTAIAQTDQYWWATVTPTGESFTSYERIRRNVSNVDGVAKTIDITYNDKNGEPSQISSDRTDGDGDTVTTNVAFSYFFEVYDTDLEFNILMPVVATTTTGETSDSGDGNASTTLEATTTRWQQSWPSGATGWAPTSTFRQTDSSAAAFSAWTPGDAVPSGWQQTNTVEDYSPSGLVLSLTDINQVTSCFIPDQKDRFISAGAYNADRQSFAFYSFEPYENPQGWATLTVSGLTPLLTTTDSHSGTTSLTLPVNTGSGVIGRSFFPPDVSATYVFGCWARSPAGFDDTKGSASATIALAWTESGTPKTATGPSLTLSSSSTSWIYLQTLIDLSSLLAGSTPDTGSLSLFFTIANANTDSSVLLDELRISPLTAGYSVNVMDTEHWVSLANIGTDGQSIQTIYDGMLRPIALRGPDWNIITAQLPGLSRQLPITDGSFSSDTPNMMLTLTPGGTSEYDDFRGDTSANWTFTNGTGGSWTIANGAMTYAGGSAGGTVADWGSATPNPPGNVNFAARIEVTPLSGASPAMGDGAVYLWWDSTANSNAGAFKLMNWDGSTWTLLQEAPASVTFGSEWFFSAIDGFYICAINGVLLFSYDAGASPTTGMLTLTVDTGASFDNLVRFDNPRQSLFSSDARGYQTQSLAFLGRPTDGAFANDFTMVTQGVFMDGLGRTIISRIPQTAAVTLASGTGSNPPQLPESTPTTYLVDGDATALTLPEYVQDGVTVSDEGTQLVYTTSEYEASPIGRPTRTIPSRPEAASAGMGYEQSISYDGVSALSPTATNGTLAYRLIQASRDTATTGSGETETAIQQVAGQIQDVDGRVLMRYLGTNSTPTALSETMTYDAAGRMLTRTQANAAALPSGTTASTWTETYSYDFLGRLTEKQSPDGGTLKIAYDSADRVRFVMDSVGAAATTGSPAENVQRIRYTRYDVLGRPVELGWIQDAGYQWDSEALTAQLDNQGFPLVSGGGGSGTTVTGRWRQKNGYDSNGSTTELYTLGRLCSTQSQPDTDGNSVTETWEYDEYGRQISCEKTVTTSAGADTQTTSFSYTPDNRLSTITYPHLSGSNPFSVGYYYDRTGRLTSIGQSTGDNEIMDPSKPIDWIPARYCAYEYGPIGERQSTAFNRPPESTTPMFTRTFDYDEVSRVSSISDNYMQISLGYTTESQTSYTGMKIASSDLTYKAGANWLTPPTALLYQYDYDDLGRLISADNNLTPAFSFETTATGAPGGYDANGNRSVTQRGLTGYTYMYPTTNAGLAGTPANGFSSLTTTTSNDENFTDASGNEAGVWSWGSNNGGPSDSTLTSDNPHSGDQCLMLGGGSALGHEETLVLDTYLSPSANLTLSFYTRTGAGYSGTPGDQASWSLVLYGLSGPVSETYLASVPSGDDWGQQTVSVDVASACSSMDLQPGQISRAVLKLVNGTRGSDNSTTGAAVYVDDLSIAWSSPPTWDAGYDLNGNVTTLPQNALTLSYDTLMPKALSADVTSGEQVSWLYDSQGQAAQQTVADNEGNTEQTIDLYYDTQGRLIARRQTLGGDTSISYFVNGPDGTVAIEQDSNLLFTLSDQQGSVRTLVNGDSGQAMGAFDYLPFGGLSRVSGDLPTLARYTNHAINPETGLIVTPARLYEPELGRFLQPDPIRDGQSPYAYVQNDPVNLVDPTGEVPVPLLIIGGSALAGAAINLWYNWNNIEGAGDASLYGLSGAAGGAIFGTGQTYLGLTVAAGGAQYTLFPIIHGTTAGQISAITTNGFNNWIQNRNFTENIGEAFETGYWLGLSGGIVSASGGLYAGVSHYYGGGGIARNLRHIFSPPTGRSKYFIGDFWQYFFNPTAAAGNDIRTPGHTGIRNTMTTTLGNLGLGGLNAAFQLDHTVPVWLVRRISDNLVTRGLVNAPNNLVPVAGVVNTLAFEHGLGLFGKALFWYPGVYWGYWNFSWHYLPSPARIGMTVTKTLADAFTYMHNIFQEAENVVNSKQQANMQKSSQSRENARTQDL